MQQLTIHTDIEQGSEKWRQLRLGKITGSSFHKLLGTKAAGKKYIYDRVSEIVTGVRSDGEENLPKVCTMHMERGNSYESIARELYTAYEYADVQQVGLVQSGNYLVCSPDGLVDDDGMIEIKVLDSNNYTMQIIEISEKGAKAIAKEHYHQMQFYLYMCNRKWCDYVLYNPKHAAVNRGFQIYRVGLDQKIQERISNAVEEAIITIDEKLAKYYKVVENHIIS